MLDVEATDGRGQAVERAAFEPATLDVSARGFAPLHLRLARSAEHRITLTRALPIVGTVTVATGSRTSLHASPLAASALDRGTIALAAAPTTDGLLRALPGFDRNRSNSAFTNYGQLRASFSGAGTDRGVVLVDGLPAQDAFGGQIDWAGYPPDELERAELLRGAGSALYGSGGVGGVLELDTFAPRTGRGASADGSATLGAGTNGFADDALVLRTPLGQSVALSLAAVSRRLAYRDLPPDYASPVDSVAVGTSGVTHLRARFDDGTTTLDGALLFASDHQDEGRTDYTFDRTLRQESAIVTHRFGATLARFAYDVRDTSVTNLADLFPTAPGVLRYVQHVPSDENGFAGSLATGTGPAHLDVLLDQRRVTGTSDQTGSGGGRQAYGAGSELTQGVGVQGTWRGRRFEAVGGARADRIRYDDLTLETVTRGATTALAVPGHDERALSPRAALRYDLTPRVALRVSTGAGFRAPYLNELVRGFNVGAVVMAPNPDLVPERSRTDGAGVDMLLGAGRLAFDATVTHVADAIAFVTRSPDLMMRENVARTRTVGETLTFAEPLAACARVRLSGTSQNARVLAGPAPIVGHRLALVPASSATLGLDGGGRAVALSLDGTYLGPTFYDDRETQPLGTSLVLAATARATTASGTTFTLAGENLTNARYLSSIDRYGIPLTVSLRIGVPIGPRPALPACAATTR